MKLYIFAILLAVLAKPADAQTEQEICASFQKSEKEANVKLPMQIDRGTELIQFRVNCDAKIVHYTKRLLVDPKFLADGWRQRKQRQHTQLHCNARGLTSTTGWTALDTMVAPDYSLLVTLETRPTDCP